MDNGQLFETEKEFFIIDSDKFETVKSGLYGYCISGGAAVTEAMLDNIDSFADMMTPDGAYIYIHRDESKITVQQDFIGAYGLYVFREGEYWVLSNSFLYLVEYVMKQHKLTFNRSYADHLLVAGLSSQSYSETLVNEITCIDRAAVVTISLDSRELATRLVDYGESTVDIDSAEGMGLLDKWYSKWTSVISGLYQKNRDMQMDLSGGFDSRVILDLFLGSGIDMNRVFVNSLNDELHCHHEDYEIASGMAEYYGFRLNDYNQCNGKRIQYGLDDVINLSFYTKLGFHTQMHWQGYRNEEYKYAFTGNGGGCIRNLASSLKWWMDEDILVEHQAERAQIYGREVSCSVKEFLEKSFDGIREKHSGFGRDIPDEYVGKFLYMETRDRNHFGKWMVESYYYGLITFCPLLDADLHKLKLSSGECHDNNLLIAVIYERYNRDLLNFRFEGGRSIAPETLEYARDINKRYPSGKENAAPALTGKTCATGYGDCKSGSDGKDEYCQDLFLNNIREYIKKAFYSEEVKNTFQSIYSRKAYYRLADNWYSTEFYPDANAYVVLPVSVVYRACANSPCADGSGIADYLARQVNTEKGNDRPVESLLYSPYMLSYITARMDIQNYGCEGNSIVVTDISDDELFINKAKWMENGDGYMLQSDRGRLGFKVCARGDGILKIALRSVDMRDRDNCRIPVWIDYYSLKINGEEVLEGLTRVCHDRPFKYEKSINDGEEADISLSWTYHDERKESLQLIADRNIKELKAANKKLSEDNSRLGRQLKETNKANIGLNKRIDTLCEDKSRLDKKLEKVNDEKRDLNSKLEKVREEKRELNSKLEKVREEKSELSNKLQITYDEKEERGKEIKRLKSEINAVKASRSYRIGRIITWPVRRLRELSRAR